jgi:hypothetical protein
VSQSYRLRLQRASLKLRVNTRIPAQFTDGDGISITKANGVYTVGLDYTGMDEITAFDAGEKLFAVYDRTTGIWNSVSLASLISSGQTYQVITTGDCTVADTDGLIIINKTVGAATGVTLPASATKVGKFKIVDFKADSGTNNITISADGSEKFNGNLSTWVISGDGGSVVLDPIPGVGYAV